MCLLEINLNLYFWRKSLTFLEVFFRVSISICIFFLWDKIFVHPFKIWNSLPSTSILIRSGTGKILFINKLSKDSPYVLKQDIFSNLYVTVNRVTNHLKDINVNKASGPDNISGLFLRNCAAELAILLTMIFNISLSSGVFPSHFKTANVIPILKKGDCHDVENYRPISLLSLISKTFEKAVYTQLFEHVKSTLISEQHGFIKNRDTVSNLISYVDHLSKAFDSKQQVDSIYLDLSKAFDSVSHELLIHKMKFYGFSGPLLMWLESYLSCWSQRVVLNGKESSWKPVLSGVPQGSLIGPLLFILYVNDVSAVISHSTPSIYADDTKLFKCLD